MEEVSCLESLGPHYSLTQGERQERGGEGQKVVDC